jgi:hypothetical protein
MRKIIRALLMSVGVSALLATSFVGTRPADAAPESSYVTYFASSGGWTCTAYGHIHSTNLYNYPYATTGLETALCIDMFSVLVDWGPFINDHYSSPPLTHYPTDAVVAGENGWFPLNSRGQVCVHPQAYVCNPVQWYH